MSEIQKKVGALLALAAIALITAAGWRNTLAEIEPFMEEFSATLTFLPSVAVAVFTWTMYRATVALVRGSTDTLITSQRPWVSVELELHEPLVITDDEVRATITFVMKNVGNSPALNVDICEKLVPFGSSIEAGKKIREDIKRRPQHPESVLGQTIFPNETLRQPLSFAIPVAEIRKSFLFGEGEHFALEVVGYVGYRTAFDDGWHVTWFGGTLARPNPDNPKNHIGFRFTDRMLQVGQYGLWADPFTTGRAD